MQVRPPQIALALVLALGLLSGVSYQRTVADAGTPTWPSFVAGQASELPADTPIARQLAWVTELLNGRADTLTKADLEARFAPSFLGTVPAADAVVGIKQFAAAYGSLTVDGSVCTPTETHSLMFLTARTGEEFILSIAVEPTVPHRITTFSFQPVPNDLAEAAASPENSGGLVDIGGRSLYLWCLGPVPAHGEPTVLLEAGYGDDSTVWLAVQAALASDTRVCSYDRANAPGGASDPAPTPRTGHDVVVDLHALLEAADVPGPYVLVGHSLGGIFVRQYASAHPNEVAGLVLVDPSHEDQEIRLEELVGPELWAQFERGEAGFVDVEGLDIDATFDETRLARATAPLPEVPLVVLTHGVPLDASQLPTGWPSQADERQWLELHADLTSLVPEGHQIVAERSGHYVQVDQPELVISAVREVMTESGGSATPKATT